MAVKLISAREAAHLNGLKVLVYGESGAGKTRLLTTTGEPTVVISAEAGLLSIRDSDVSVIEVGSIADVHEAYEFLAGGDGARFKWVCLDSISEIAEVVLADEKRNEKDPRRAYGAMSEQMVELVKAFRDLPGRNVYVSAKLDKVKDEITGGLMYGPSAPGQQLGKALPYLFDEVWMLRVERDADGNLTRWLQTQGDNQRIAKDRSGALEMFETPDLAAVIAKIFQPKLKKAA